MKIEGFIAQVFEDTKWMAIYETFDRDPQDCCDIAREFIGIDGMRILPATLIVHEQWVKP